MLKRSLRIIKRTKNIPVRGVCESCNREFFADARNLGQAGIQQQFNVHKCKVPTGTATSGDPVSGNPVSGNPVSGNPSPGKPTPVASVAKKSK
jgi:hypothetical protein